jgi:hypothetical protein
MTKNGSAAASFFSLTAIIKPSKKFYNSILILAARETGGFEQSMPREKEIAKLSA